MNSPTTSHGQTLLRSLIASQLTASFTENVRPDWLHGLELDFYCEPQKIAFEFQGGQHFAPVHGLTQMHAQRRRDREKKRLCRERGVRLVVLDASDLIKSRFRGAMNARGLGHLLRAFVKGGDFNRTAAAYRQTLKTSFNCPTASRRRSAARRMAMADKFRSAMQHGEQ